MRRIGRGPWVPRLLPKDRVFQRIASVMTLHIARSRRWVIAVISAVAIVSAFRSAALAQTVVARKYRETPLGPMSDELRPSSIVSADARHIAYVRRTGTGEAAVFDGREEPAYDQVAALAFSPDGKHRAYAARRGSAWRVVINGREQPEYDRVGPPVFAPSGKRLAYVARPKGTESRVVVEAPGGPGKPYDEIFEGLLVFSPDGARLAYGARRDGRWYVVDEGREFGPYDYLGSATGLVFSPDGKQLAWAALAGKQWQLVVDGRAGPAYDNLADVVFSGDGQRIAYAAQRGDQWMAVIDHKEQSPHRAIAEGMMAFSPGGGWLAYVARTDEQWQIIVGRQRWKPFDSVRQILFSPDNKRLAGIVVSEGAELVVVNNREGRIFDRVGGGTLVFSPDGSRLGYIAKAGQNTFAVVEGRRLPRYDMAGYLTFSPNGRAVYAATRGDKAFTVVEDQEAAHHYREIWTSPDAKLHFDDPQRFHYLGLREGQIFLVEEELSR